MKHLILALAIVLAAAPAAVAQPRNPNKVIKNADLKRQIRMMRAYALTEELALDEATSTRLFPVLARFDDISDQLLVQRQDLQRQLKNPPPDPRAVNQLIDASIANQHALWDTQDKRLVEIRKVLSPDQTARLLVVLPQIERKLEQQLRAAAGGGGGGGGGKLGKGGRHVVGNPFNDEPDGPPGKTAPTNLKDPYGE